MNIDGPMNITIADPADGQGKLLMIRFSPEFQAKELPEQAAEFKSHLGYLGEQIEAIGSEEDRNRAGMMIIQQFCEQLLPHIEQGELALEEQIVLQVRQASQVVALTDLLS